MITNRPNPSELSASGRNLEFLINSQALILTGSLAFMPKDGNPDDLPLEEWNTIQNIREGDTESNLVSEDVSQSLQRRLENNRRQWLRDNEWIIGAPANSQGKVSAQKSSEVMPFRLEVAPRIQFFVHITLEHGKGAKGVLVGEYYSNYQDFTQWFDYPSEFDEYNGGGQWGTDWLDVGMVEGDYIQWDGTYFDVYHYGQLIFRSDHITSENYIIPLGAQQLRQTQTQAEEQGRMDDPLTLDVDETIDLDTEGEGFRPIDYNKNRIMEIRRALAYKNGNQAIGSLFLALLSYGAFMIIRGGE